MSHHILRVRTDGRGFFDISRDVQSALEHAAHDAGICHVFIRHTSASLLITENAAPEVRDDLERFFARLVADGDPLFSHDDEGPDDMPAHIRCALTQTSLSIPFADKRLLLGTWQGIYLLEHRYRAHQREVIVTCTASY